MTAGVRALADAHRRGERSVAQTCEAVLERLAAGQDPAAWIALVGPAALRARARELDAGSREGPLLGVPFAVKDNIDVAGMPTTAACPDFAYTPSRSATVVRRLLDAGALLIGRTNMDQFATGLVGIRSPHGACSSVAAPGHVSGGSSSGSGVVVADGTVAFALGTDTAGSGRVPAAFNGIVGCKPTIGRLSMAGVVPACRTLDCVSIFARDAGDAGAVLAAAEGFDAADAYSRAAPPDPAGRPSVIGVPRAQDVAALEPGPARDAWTVALARAARVADRIVEIDLGPFLAVARLLYEGPWVAERYAAVGAFLEREDVTADPTVRQIVLAGGRLRAGEAFAGLYRLAELRRASEPAWEHVDALLVPTAPHHPTHAEVAADPVGVNARLGTWTNFVNLLDLAAVAVPAAPRTDGLPFGVTFVAPAWQDRPLLRLAGAFAAAGGPELTGAAAGGPELTAAAGGGRGHAVAANGRPPLTGAVAGGHGPALSDAVAANCPPLTDAAAAGTSGPAAIDVAVVGAHLRGMPRHHELVERGATLVRETRTAACYRLYDLCDGTGRPGLVREDGGAAIVVEVWRMSAAAFGTFVAAVAAPLAIGTLELADGTHVHGFLCEAHATADARDVSAHGGWRAYRCAAA